MYMNKNMLRGCAVLAILLVAYLLVIFLIPFAHTAVFWVSFVFTLIAFGVVAAACWLAFVRKPDAKSRFYGFPIARIGVIYGAAQLVCGLAFMALGKWVPVWAAVLVYALGLGAAAIGLIAADTVAEEIQAQDVRLKVNVSFMRDLQSKVNRMAAQCELAELRQLSEDIRYSDPVSSDALAEIERDLAAAVDDLQAAVVEGDWQAARTLCRNASALLTERNRLCKLNKK